MTLDPTFKVKIKGQGQETWNLEGDLMFN